MLREGKLENLRSGQIREKNQCLHHLEKYQDLGKLHPLFQQSAEN